MGSIDQFRVENRTKNLGRQIIGVWWKQRWVLNQNMQWEIFIDQLRNPIQEAVWQQCQKTWADK